MSNSWNSPQVMKPTPPPSNNTSTTSWKPISYKGPSQEKGVMIPPSTPKAEAINSFGRDRIPSFNELTVNSPGLSRKSLPSIPIQTPEAQSNFSFTWDQQRPQAVAKEPEENYQNFEQDEEQRYPDLIVNIKSPEPLQVKYG